MKRICIIAGCLLAAHAASAGVYVETIKHTLSTGSTEPQQKMYVQNGSGRFVDPEGHTTLIKNDTLYILDDANQSYIVFDKATMEAMAKKIADGMERMKQQLAKLPPEQREQLEGEDGRLTGAPGATHTVEVANLGKSDTVGGRPCKLWNVARDGELDEQICVVAYSALPGKENFQALFASFSNVFEEMAKSVPTLSGVMANEFSAQVKVGGFPVRQRSYEEGKLGDEETLVKEWREEAFRRRCSKFPPATSRSRCPWDGDVN